MKMIAVAPHHRFVQPILASYISFGVGCYCFIHTTRQCEKPEKKDKADIVPTPYFFICFLLGIGWHNLSRNMEKISRKEAFDCTLALYASIINAINEEKEKLYDFALILQSNSSSSIICLKPGKNFEWNQSEYGEYTYAFIPVLHNYIAASILKHCGTDSDYYKITCSFEKFKAYEHPCSWIKEVLTKKYLQLSYWGGTLMDNKLEYDSSFLSKTHSTWVCAKVDGVTVYFPYYTQSERQKAFNKLGDFYTKMTKQYWEDFMSF